MSVKRIKNHGKWVWQARVAYQRAPEVRDRRLKGRGAHAGVGAAAGARPVMLSAAEPVVCSSAAAAVV
jgi:hypothetical protein